jgi:hypothetical protein
MKPIPTGLRNHVFSALCTGIIERDPFNRVRIIQEISKATSRDGSVPNKPLPSDQ